MRAIVREKFGGLDSLVYKDIPESKPRAGHVVIQIKAFGINHAEMHMRRGEWAEAAPVSGIECVGLVRSCPGGEFPVGAKVAALMGGLGRTINGSYAEYTRAPAWNVGAPRAVNVVVLTGSVCRDSGSSRPSQAGDRRPAATGPGRLVRPRTGRRISTSAPGSRSSTAAMGSHNLLFGYRFLSCSDPKLNLEGRRPRPLCFSRIDERAFCFCCSSHLNLALGDDLQMLRAAFLAECTPRGRCHSVLELLIGPHFALAATAGSSGRA
jgi:hypothetical protein